MSIRSMSSLRLRKHAITSVKKLGFYPVILAICWMTNAYKETVYALYPEHSYGLGNLVFMTYGLPFLIGTASAIAFMVTNKRLMRLWSGDLLKRVGLISNIGTSMRSDSVDSTKFDYTDVPDISGNNVKVDYDFGATFLKTCELGMRTEPRKDNVSNMSETKNPLPIASGLTHTYDNESLRKQEGNRITDKTTYTTDTINTVVAE